MYREDFIHATSCSDPGEQRFWTYIPGAMLLLPRLYAASRMQSML